MVYDGGNVDGDAVTGSDRLLAGGRALLDEAAAADEIVVLAAHRRRHRIAEELGRRRLLWPVHTASWGASWRITTSGRIARGEVLSTPAFDDLRRHLVAAHCNGAGLELIDAEAADQHHYDHFGDGGVHNHDAADLSWTQARVDEILAEFDD